MKSDRRRQTTAVLALGCALASHERARQVDGTARACRNVCALVNSYAPGDAAAAHDTRAESAAAFSAHDRRGRFLVFTRAGLSGAVALQLVRAQSGRLELVECLRFVRTPRPALVGHQDGRHIEHSFQFWVGPLGRVWPRAMVAAHDSRLAEVPADLLVVAESAVLALNLNELAKRSFARERPFVHARSPVDRAAARSGSDDLSFFSGHATLAFALATSAGTVASLRHYRLAPLMWSMGMLFAATGSYLRIAADQHYATDVLTGVAVGAASGFALPYFAHATHGARLSVAPIRGGLSAVGIW